MEISVLLCSIVLIGVLQTAVAQQAAKPYNPCEPYNPGPPNFYKPGRRLSTIKCIEYIWDIKYRQDLVQRKKDCDRQKGFFTASGIGGRDTNEGEFPHMAAIGWKATDSLKKWIFKCGGSLISDRFVLTAGHCVFAPADTTIADSIPKIVRLGNKNIAENELHTDIDIKRIIKHPQYKPPRKYYDIALMELNNPVQFNYLIHPACLLIPNDVRHFGPQATATGWGVTKYGGSTTEELQAVHINLLDTDLCNKYIPDACNRNWCGLVDHQICAANLTGGVDTCEGDSGGPLQVNIPLPDNAQEPIHGIVGVTSFGFKCALANTPGIYTKVSYFLDWIEEIVWKRTS